jgi:hypothetical protein
VERWKGGKTVKDVETVKLKDVEIEKGEDVER